MKLLPGLYYATACVAGMGTLMLGVSEDNYLLVALAVIVSVASPVLCDVTRWMQLNTWTSNGASVAALVVAGWRYQTLSPDERILAVADLMGYLQFILQFRAKTVRNLWLLAVVSFLQVSVAAALHTGFTFALLLTVYLFAGVFFLALFYLYREQLRQADARREAEGAAEQRGSGFAAARPVVEPAAPQMRQDFSRKLIGTALGTVLMAVFFFVAVPRIGQSNWVPTAIVAARAVGFSTEINLARSGEIVEDPEVVMQVKFFAADTEQPYQIDGEPYFRGMSLSYYNRGYWRGTGLRYRSGMPPPPPPLPQRDGLVRQQVVIEPLSTTTLFACAPWFSETADDRLTTVPYTNQLNRRDGLRTVRFTYSLLTSAFRNHRQVDIMAAPVLMRDDDALLRLPSAGPEGDPLARLKSTASSIVAGIPSGDVIRRAKALEAYLRDSGKFQYTLQSPVRPAGIDPLEDFVADNPRGHCEYFAGALALMLRSVGVPARIVVGYRGGEWNVVGNFYQVRQLNAHSWVEAFVPPGVAPRERFSNAAQADAAEQTGAWLRLDPTTTNDVAATAAGNSRWGEIQQVIDYFKFVWNNYVVGMDAVKQHESVYQPVVDQTRDFYHRVTAAETWQELFRYVDPRSWPSRLANGSWLPAAAGLALTFGLAATIAAAIRRRRVHSEAPGGVTAASRRPAAPVDFYVRLEQVLANRRLRRTPEQTQREFIQSVCGELAELPATRGMAAVPRRIVEAFYRVRFGGRTLTDDERAEVEQALAALSAALTPGSGGDSAAAISR